MLLLVVAHRRGHANKHSFQAFCRGALLRHQLQSLDSAEARREAMMARATGVDALDINDHDHVAVIFHTINWAINRERRII